MLDEEEQYECPQRSFVYVPRGVAHTFEVTSTTPGTKLNIFAPSATVGFFRDLAAAETAGTPTPRLLGEIAERSQMELLGPVPETYL